MRDVLGGDVLLARILLSSGQDDLVRRIGEVKATLDVPIASVISHGQHSIRKAAAEARTGVSH